MPDKQALLNRRINEVLYHFESPEYDTRHPETVRGDSLWWNELGSRHLKINNANLRILDAGAGTGMVASCFNRYLKYPALFVCYDICENMLKQAKLKLQDNSSFRYVKGDAADLPFPDESFDFIVFNSLLHHLLDYKHFLKECNRVLKKNGVIAFAHEPNKEFLQSKLCFLLSTLYNLCFPVNITKELQDKVNFQLKKERLIENSLTRDEIRRLAEIHSPMEQSSTSVDSSKGFIYDNLISEDFPGYKVLELCEYSTYFHRPIFEKTGLSALAGRSIVKLIFKRGNLFRAVLKKWE